MPTCPINLFPLSLSMLLFICTQRKHCTLSAQNNVNAECTTKVRFLKYLRFGGTSYTQEGPHQRASVSDRLRQWSGSRLFRLSCSLSPATTPDGMWGLRFSVQPPRAAPWYRGTVGVWWGSLLNSCHLPSEYLRGCPALTAPTGDQETALLWVLWPFINVLPSESSCVRRACCRADKDSPVWEGEGAWAWTLNRG